MDNKDIVNNKIKKLRESKFRNNFRLKEKDKEYVKNSGIDKIIEHAYDFVRNRLGLKEIVNDGKQTPMKGHPVFIAQHATGTCCRNCLYKWHGIRENKELNDNEINYIVSIIIAWIVNQMRE